MLEKTELLIEVWDGNKSGEAVRLNAGRLIFKKRCQMSGTGNPYFLKTLRGDGECRGSGSTNERKRKMIYINEDGSASSSYSYHVMPYGNRSYEPSYDQSRSHEYDRGYGHGKVTACLGTAALGAALAYFLMKKINEA